MMSGIFSGFIRNFIRVVWGKSLLWHSVAIVVTFALVTTGFDWWFYEQTRSAFFYPIIWAAGIGGFFLPVLVPIAMYVVGEIRDDVELKKKATALAQAVVIAWILIAVYKTFTGRIPPEFMNTVGNTDISREFQFGFFRGGIFWGWPSSHAAVAVAGGVSMLRLYKNFWVRTPALLYMLIVAIGAAIGFHWFSDVVAGTIFGILIGNVVWRNFRE